jgi:hypothetical protein
MSNVAVRVDGLGKMYRIGSQMQLQRLSDEHEIWYRGRLMARRDLKKPSGH